MVPPNRGSFEQLNKEETQRDQSPILKDDKKDINDHAQGVIDLNDLHQDPNDMHGDISCVLCQRSRPIFLVDSDDMILRLPEKFLPPFLKAMKAEYLAKRPFLNFLRINSKLISMCACQHRMSHAYCVTANVLRTQKIYCKDCFSYFHLYVKSERILSSEYMGGMMRLMILSVTLLGLIFLVYEIDKQLKNMDYRTRYV